MIKTAPTATKRHVKAGIAQKIKIVQVYYHSIMFLKASGLPGRPDPLCAECGFSLSGHTTIKVLDEKGKEHAIHHAHVKDQ